MKWSAKSKRYPKEGDIRTLNRFAFLPVRLSNNTFVWLERYKEDQKYRATDITYVGTIEWGGWDTVRKHQDTNQMYIQTGFRLKAEDILEQIRRN